MAIKIRIWDKEITVTADAETIEDFSKVAERLGCYDSDGNTKEAENYLKYLERSGEAA